MAAFEINPATDLKLLSAGAVKGTHGGLYVAVAGDFTFTMIDSDTPITVTLSAGYHPLQIKNLGSGSDLYGLYHR